MPKYGCFLIFLQIYLATVLVVVLVARWSLPDVGSRYPLDFTARRLSDGFGYGLGSGDDAGSVLGGQDNNSYVIAQQVHLIGNALVGGDQGIEAVCGGGPFAAAAMRSPF